MPYIWALFILQFHLARHALTRGKVFAYIAVGIIATGAILAAGVLGWLCYHLGKGWFPAQPHGIVLLAFNALFLFYSVAWFWGLVMEVQRSDVIDVRKMRHFPVPLWVVNGINFAVSLVGFMSLFFLGGAGGLLVGLAQIDGHGVLPGVLAAAAFYFLSASWAYYIRGLLVVWMEDKRRRRLLLTVLPILFMVLGFAPMILSNYLSVVQDTDAVAAWLAAPEHLVWVERTSFFHPGGLISLALTTVWTGEGYYWAPLFGLVSLGVLGYYLGFKNMQRYGFENYGSGPRAGKITKVAGVPWTARKIPFLQDETGALTQALFLNFVRHPQVRTMLLAPIGLVVLLAVANSRSFILGQDLGLPLMALLWPFFMFSGIFFNLFGMDQRGFRTIVLLPTPRHRILLAYHLALLPLAGGLALTFALFGSWYFSMGVESTVVALLQVVQLFLNFSLAGSFISIYAPMSVGRNMMRRQQSRVLLVALLMPFVVGLLVLPTTLCVLIDGVASRWGLVDYPVAIVLSLGLLILTAIAHPFILRHAGNLLMEREQGILARLQKTAE